MPRSAVPHRKATPRPAPAPAPATSVFPSWRALVDVRGPFLVPLALLVLARLVMFYAAPAPSEDAFITFRYARNLATGLGLVYNAGEHVMGFTSPVWTVWNALGQRLIGTPVPWAELTSFIADIVTLLVAGALAVPVAGALGAWFVTFVLAVSPVFAALTVSGMEMSLFVCLLVLSAALARRRHAAAGVVLALLALTRPEGLVAAAIVGIGASRRDRIVAFAIVAAALAALTWRFGSPIPNSVTVKAGIYGMAGPWRVRDWWEWIVPVVLGRWPQHGESMVMMILVVVTAPAAVAGARELWRRRDSGLALAAAAAVVIWLGYVVVGVAYFWWYFAIPLLAAVLLVGAGLPRVVRGPGIPVALALCLLSEWSIALSLYSGRSHEEIQSFGAMAGALRARCAPQDTVMLEPIGMIGFTCPVTVIDETGLVTPAVAQRRMQGPGWYTDVVTARRPRWLVIRRRELVDTEAFAGTGRPFRNAAERDALLARYRTVDRAGNPDSPNELLLLERTP